MSIRRVLPFVLLIALSACDFEPEVTPIEWPTAVQQPFEETSSAPTVPLETPLGTPFVQPTPLPASTPYPQMFVTEDGLRLRDAPGLESNTIIYLTRGTIVSVIGSPINIEGEIWAWQEVELADGQRGFVAVDYLSFEISEISWVIGAPLANDGLYQSGHGHGDTVDQGLHTGYDIWANEETLRANADSRVYMYQTWKDDDGWHVERYNADDAQDNDDLSGFGNYIILETEVAGETYYQVLAHMDGFSPDLEQGQQIQAGTELGTMGDTGFTDGAHVHWEVRRDAGVRVTSDGTHIFDVYYPEDEDELDELFIDPDDFVESLD